MTDVKRLCLIFAALILVILAGCGIFRPPEQTAVPPPTSAGATSVNATAEISTPDGGTPTSVPTDSGPETLVLWTSEDYAPTSETEGGMLLLEQIQNFQSEYGVGVDVILKRRTGTGGLLDFLVTSSAAAPSILPDLITLSNVDLYRAARAGLLQPLDTYLSPEFLDDQFDFARALVQLGGTTFGVLYQADLDHLVYDTAAFETPPLTWEDVYTSTEPFVFSPVAPVDKINDVILIQYLDLGGTLTDAAGQPSLNGDQLIEALSFFQQARRAGVIPVSVLDLSDATTAWATYRIGEAGMVQGPASIYLAERAGLSSSSASAVPLVEPGTTTVGHGWALAMVTQDPARQELAAALIEHLLSPENNGAWTQAANRLPASGTALDAWAPNDAYVPLVRELLRDARPAADPGVAAAIGPPLSQALTDVISGRASPEEAAEAAVQAVEAGR
jgi:ABC-type glycerol-3-phosphate transport system substrate-binding protein